MCRALYLFFGDGPSLKDAKPTFAMYFRGAFLVSATFRPYNEFGDGSLLSTFRCLSVDGVEDLGVCTRVARDAVL